MAHIRETIGGWWELLRMAAMTRFRLGGEYWSWRRHTAFGEEGAVPAAQRRRAMMEYARWVYRMRRTMR